MNTLSFSAQDFHRALQTLAALQRSGSLLNELGGLQPEACWDKRVQRGHSPLEYSLLSSFRNEVILGPSLFLSSHPINPTLASLIVPASLIATLLVLLFSAIHISGLGFNTTICLCLILDFLLVITLQIWASLRSIITSIAFL